MPVLAIQAVIGTGLEKYGQILVSGFSSRAMGIGRVAGRRTTRADPIGNAVGGQGIMVPAQSGLCGGAARQPAVPVLRSPQ